MEKKTIPSLILNKQAFLFYENFFKTFFLHEFNSSSCSRNCLFLDS